MSENGGSDEPEPQNANSFLSSLFVIMRSIHGLRRDSNESGMARSAWLQSGWEYLPPPSSKLNGKELRDLIGIIFERSSQGMSATKFDSNGKMASANLQAKAGG